MTSLRIPRARSWNAAAVLSLPVLLVASWTNASAQGVGPHFGLGYLGGEDVGLDDGYTQFGAFVPLLQPSGNVLFFSDTHLLLYNEQSDAIGGNFGGGARIYNRQLNRIFGGYAYYDFRDRDLADYDQVGFGVETLGSVFDGRVNVNLPTNTDNAFVSTSIFDIPFFGGPGGQNIVVGADHFQQALSTVDLEAGALLLGNPQAQLKGYVGSYGLFAEGINEWGARGRLELRAHDQVWLGGFVQNDGIFGTTGGFTVELRFGRGHAPSSYCCVASRMGDPIERRQYIAVRDSHQDILATDNGTAITVLHVDSNAAAGGSGGFQDPVDTLADASNQPQDIVFVHGDSVFTGEAMVISTEGQRFLAEGVPHQFVSDQGTFPLPGAIPAGATPRILDSTGVAVTIAANDVEASGFEIDGPGLAGFFGDGVSGFDVNRNTITQSDAIGVGFDNVTGAGSIVGNISNDNAFNGFVIIGDNIGTFANNTASGNGADGFEINGDNTGTFTNNVASENGANGFEINGDNTGTFTNNVANGNGDRGFFFFDNSGTVEDNTATGNADVGYAFASNNGTFTGNTATGNENGFRFLNNNGTFTDNTATDNDLDGFSFNDNTGTFTNNTASGQGEYGFFFNSNTGTFTNNAASGNDTAGFLFGSNTGTFTDNTASGNELAGFFFASNNGTFTDNTASGNGRDANNAIVNANADGFGFAVNEGTVANNTATNNANNGFAGILANDDNFFNQPASTFSDNVANDNGDRGYRGTNLGTANNNTGAGNANGGNTFP